DDLEMDPAPRARLRVQPGDQLPRDGHRDRGGIFSGLRADLAAAAGEARRLAHDAFLSQRAVARAAVLLHVPAAVPGDDRRYHDPDPRLDEGNAGSRATGDGERVRDRARRGAIDPDDAMGIGGFAR